MTRPRHVPQRSCVACRQVRPKAELLRIVRTPAGEVCVDESGKLAGRGAYLCPNEHCVEQAAKQKRLGRALGVAVGPEVTEAIRNRLASDKPAGAFEGGASDR
ncbi:MAG: YlxR family protein [Armatimonadota bacterium]|nr:YlxR family protein [Armatimonadota bacterium]